MQIRPNDAASLVQQIGENGRDGSVIWHQRPVVSGQAQESLELFLVLGSRISKQCHQFLLVQLDSTKANVVVQVVQINGHKLALSWTDRQVRVHT